MNIPCVELKLKGRRTRGTIYVLHGNSLLHKLESQAGSKDRDVVQWAERDKDDWNSDCFAKKQCAAQQHWESSIQGRQAQTEKS